MSLINLAAQLFISKLGGSGDALSEGGVVQALQGLLPTQGGELDLSALLGQFSGGGADLAGLASSWLGGGENAAFSADQVLELLGSGPVAEFAGKLGLDQATAAGGLAEMIPELIDQNSEGGALLGGAAGGLLKGMLGKLFS